jgi:hypothetical protein
LEDEERWLRYMGLAVGTVSGAALVALWPAIVAFAQRTAQRGCCCCRRANARST